MSTPDDILVLQNAGPHAAGMPEAGYLPIPKKLAQAGVKDMVRISDARMSGTAFGTIVLHVAPEAAVGRPAGRRAQRRPDPALGRGQAHRPAGRARRRSRAVWRAFSRHPHPTRGYKALYRRTVLQAPQGCDFDFLTGSSSDG